MQISLDHYRIFYAVAKSKSFTAAARALFSSQPNVSRAIRNLENALGCPLFLRLHSGVILTPEGERLYAHVKVAFEHIKAGETELFQQKGLTGGSVFVGTTEISLRCFLLPILQKFRTLYPGVTVHITNQSTPQAAASLLDGLLDFAVVTTPTEHSPRLRQTRLKTVWEVPVCGAGYPELARNPVSLEQLVQYPIISVGKQAKTYERYADFFDRNGQDFFPDIVAETLDQVLLMVKSDLGVGFVPEEMLTGETQVFKVNLKEKIPPRQICLLEETDRPLSLAAKELKRLMLEEK